MIHPDLTKTLELLGLTAAREVFHFERRRGNWAYLCLREELPSLSDRTAMLVWEMIATSTEGPVCQLESVSLTIRVVSSVDVGVDAELRKTWKLEDLLCISGNQPAKMVMLQYLRACRLLLFEAEDVLADQTS